MTTELYINLLLSVISGAVIIAVRLLFGIYKKVNDLDVKLGQQIVEMQQVVKITDQHTVLINDIRKVVRI